MTRISGLLCALALCALPAAAGAAPHEPTTGRSSEVIVTLSAPPLAGLTGQRALTGRLRLEREQERFKAVLAAAIPEARIRWRYTIVLNAAAVVVPESQIRRLRELPGVKAVDHGAVYRVATVTTADLRAAADRWQTGLANKGDGMKIGIIDDGIDQTHPYFAPAGYTMPPGFPKGQTSYTTAKVIVARAFAPPGSTWRNARKPFDPEGSEHGTHVAGIAAGNAGTPGEGGATLSGIAPRAYLGNYKALSIPTDAAVGLDGNAPELVAAIESAVADGMDVINLSLGEPEIEPSRDIVALALDGAARAGVVPVVAAGNDFEEFGRGSLSSPGSSDLAITVAAISDTAGRSVLADFSAAGPSTLSLRLKPDISAPGSGIVSAAPGGGWTSLSGTSMASPHIAAAAALLLERHPGWSVAELKAALIGSGSPVEVGNTEASPTRGGGGLAEPAHADVPLVLASPASVSFGFVAGGSTVPAAIALANAGGGEGAWNVAVKTTATTAGASIVVPASISVPGALDASAVVAPDANEGDLAGYIELTRGADKRRIPFWLRVTRPGLGAAQATPIGAPGRYVGDTRGRPALVARYRYPEVPTGGSVTANLLGPERVYRFTVRKPLANFGVVITRRDARARVEPRVVVAGDENRLTGYAALPLNLNPYLEQFGSPVLAAGAIRPLAGAYDIVFDSATPAGAGSFAFRFWVDDMRPPTVALQSRSARRGSPIVIRAADTGSGVDPATVKLSLDGRVRPVVFRSGSIRLPTGSISRGLHRLRVQISDYQESRNMENVPPILPNTRVVTRTIEIR